MIKLQVVGGKCTPAPPVGPALGQHGVNIGEFVKRFNDATGDRVGKVLLDHGYTAAEQVPVALDYLGQVVTAQATSLAFKDGFTVLAIGFALAAVSALALAGKPRARELPRPRAAAGGPRPQPASQADDPLRPHNIFVQGGSQLPADNKNPIKKTEQDNKAAPEFALAQSEARQQTEAGNQQQPE